MYKSDQDLEQGWVRTPRTHPWKRACGYWDNFYRRLYSACYGRALSVYTETTIINCACSFLPNQISATCNRHSRNFVTRCSFVGNTVNAIRIQAYVKCLRKEIRAISLHFSESITILLCNFVTRIKQLQKIVSVTDARSLSVPNWIAAGLTIRQN